MTPAAAIPVFLVSITVMLAASAVFARRLDHIGLGLGLPETMLGLLTALAADAPEISSAISAVVQHQQAVAVGVVVGSNAFNIAAMLGLSAVLTARVRARHEALELEGFVGLWLVAVTLAVVAGGVGARVGAGLVALVAVPYVVVLGTGQVDEGHRPARSVDWRREAARLVVVLLLALALIVAGSIGAVRSATDLAHTWSVPEVLVGGIVLAILTSLPNAWTGIRFGLQQRGSALISEALNSNSINIVAGLAVPAALGSLDAFSGLDVFNVAWLLGMTAAALVLFGRRGGAGRRAGAFLIALYLVFLAVQVANG
jgi:cation:H+ antiporter